MFTLIPIALCADQGISGCENAAVYQLKDGERVIGLFCRSCARRRRAESA